MDKTDFTFMKSGHDLLEKKDETLENVGSIAMVFMENAIRNAEIYIKHAKRKSITPEDIKRGFMLEVFFMKSRPNMEKQCEEMKKKIKEIIKEEEDADDDEETINLVMEQGRVSRTRAIKALDNNDNDPINAIMDLMVSGEEKEKEEEEEVDEPFTESECACPMCSCFNTIYTRWEKFTPQLPLEKVLVKCINEIN
jgi:NACalpha-BTF3-like transcription factor